MAADHLTAFIPVRGGSKAIPGKNLKVVAGKPLVDWTVEACLGAASVGAVVISTDDPEMVSHVEGRSARWGPSVSIHHRSAASATDGATTESVMLEWARAEDAAHIALVQATSPLLTAHDVEEAWRAYRAPEWDSVLSVVRQRRFRWEVDAAGARSPDYNPAARPRRQEMQGFLVENGAIYITSRRLLLASGCRISGRVGVIEMAPETYVEVDEPEDLEVVASLLRSRVKLSGHRPQPPGGIGVVFTDIDGVLTDNGMVYASDGTESKVFSARDGKGFELLRLAGIKTVLITSESGEQISNRARKLRVDALVMASTDKLADAEKICSDLGLGLHQAAFIGDDLHDLGLLRAVGFSACPADAVQVVRDAVDHCGSIDGGAGAFRELADVILAASG